MKSKPLAAIDIGTNTFRLLIAVVQPQATKKKNYTLKKIYSERIITRLGEGILESGLIKEEAIERSISALKKFSDIIAHHNVCKTSAVATSALREAKNSDVFLKKAREATGLKIKIISGEKEAKKTSLGMLIGITPPETALMVDIGGGSTELIFTRREKPLLIRSLNLGVVYLAGKYMKYDPPREKDLKQMGNEILHVIMSTVKPFTMLFSKNTILIGTAGTATALAAITQRLIKYEHNKIHNTKITLEKVKSIFSNISTITAKERVRYLPFEPARLDIIVPGALILIKLMEIFGFKKVTISNYGLREGILLDLYKNRK